MLYRRASLGTLGARAEPRPLASSVRLTRTRRESGPAGGTRRFLYVDTIPHSITSTGPVLLCRPRRHSVGIGQRAKHKLPHGRVPRTPSPVFPLPALPAKVFRSACSPVQPASPSSCPSVLRKLFLVAGFVLFLHPFFVFSAMGFFGGTGHLP